MNYKFSYFTFMLVFCISGCSGTHHYEHFNVEEQNGFWRSYAYTEMKQDGQPIPGSGKLTICGGYSTFVADVMRNAAIVGSAALIGAGLGSSGDSNNTNINNRSSSNSGASSNATASANASSGASAALGNNAPVMPPSPHHYRELKPHEHSYYGVD